MPLAQACALMLQPFRSLLYEALRDFATRGYQSEADLQDWLRRLQYALQYELPTDDWTRKQLTHALSSIYNRDVVRGAVAKYVPGVSRYTLDRIQPSLRAELDRRIFAGVDLIKLNKRAATEKTLQRFSGWVSSVPRGGSHETDIRSVVREIAKPVQQVRYEARRCAIDQAAKLSSAISHTVAMQEGAVFATWHDRGEHDRSYNARKEHLARSGKVYLVRNSWAFEEGLIRKGGLPYTDEIDQPAEAVFCSCWWEWGTSPRGLPPELLTAKGREASK